MPRRVLPRLAALLVALCGWPLAGERLPVQSYDLGRGLAGDRVWDLELDPAGALWIATSTGVSRFDGLSFRNFDARHGLASANVFQLLRTRDGRFVAGTASGVSLLDPVAGHGERPWRTLPAEAERGGGQLIALAEDADGTIWAGGLLGLFRVAGPVGAERLVAAPLPAAEPRVRLLAADGDGGLWVELGRGLYRRERSGSWRGPWAAPAQLADVAGLSDLAVDARGVLWLASRQAVCGQRPAHGKDGEPELRPGTLPLVALARTRPPEAAGIWVCVEVSGGLPATRTMRRLDAAPEGGLFVTGADGVVEITPAGLELRLAAREADGATLQAALEGPDATLWVGSADQGLLRLVRSGVELPAGGELLPGAVSTLLAETNEPLVVLDYLDPSRRLLRATGAGWRDVTPPGAGALQASWGWGAISALAPDGAWWVGRSGGVERFPPRPAGSFGPARPAPRALAQALVGQEPIRLFFARSGTLWVGTHAPVGLHALDLATGGVRTFSELADFPNGAPTALAEAADGTIWVGFFRGGLARRRSGGAAAETGPFEWLAGAAAVAPGFVHALHFDAHGQLWVGTGSGLSVCRAPGATDPRCERALPGSELDQLPVACLGEDSAGWLLAGTSKGLFRLDPSSGRLDVLTTAEGLPANNILALAAAGDGAVWIATAREVARFRPPPPAGPAAPLRLVAVDVAGRSLPIPIGGVEQLSRLELAPGERFAELEVASIHLGPGPPPAYQWRLGGGAWSAPSAERRLRLGGLAAGDLGIEARAVSAAGVPGPAVRVDLRVLPPLWRRGWFLALVGVVIAAGVVTGHRFRVARLLELERVRTRIAADLHDDLGSSLSRISILAEVARRQGPGENAALLDTIGVSARELAEMASDIVWAIDPQRDDLASWAARLRRFGEDLLAPLGVELAVEVPADAASIRLAAAARRDLFLLAKEALNNAAKYAGARTVRVSAERVGGRLELAIEDDGGGIGDAAAALAAARGGGHGLRTMRARGARLGGRLEIAPRAGGGTRIALDFLL